MLEGESGVRGDRVRGGVCGTRRDVAATEGNARDGVGEVERGEAGDARRLRGDWRRCLNQGKAAPFSGSRWLVEASIASSRRCLSRLS
jgi:hypothetical protein